MPPNHWHKCAIPQNVHFSLISSGLQLTVDDSFTSKLALFYVCRLLNLFKLCFQNGVRKHNAFFFNQSGPRLKEVLPCLTSGSFPYFAPELHFPAVGTTS